MSSGYTCFQCWSASWRTWHEKHLHKPNQLSEWHLFESSKLSVYLSPCFFPPHTSEGFKCLLATLWHPFFFILTFSFPLLPLWTEVATFSTTTCNIWRFLSGWWNEWPQIRWHACDSSIILINLKQSCCVIIYAGFWFFATKPPLPELKWNHSDDGCLFYHQVLSYQILHTEIWGLLDISSFFLFLSKKENT